MSNFHIFITVVIFSFTLLMIVWRPRGINEAIPACFGASVLLVTGAVPLAHTVHIFNTISGAVITILSTIIMSLVLDSIGFFRWTAENMIRWANGSGTLLFFYVCLLCFLMTLFFNNDGSILMTTPIIIHILSMLNLKAHEKLPYLFAGALVATASSAPIAVSNLANLIALRIVGLDINAYVTLMFVPSLAGIVTLGGILYLYFKKAIPRRIPIFTSSFPSLVPPKAMFNPKRDHFPRHHPLMEGFQENKEIDYSLFRLCIGIVIITRASLFLGSSLGIPLEAIALSGAVSLILVRWRWKGMGARDVLKNSPWPILIFAFSIYVVIHALHLAGLTSFLVAQLEPLLTKGHLEAIMVTGFVVMVMANLFNNIPAVMVGTLTLTEMNLGMDTLQLAYLANIVGSDLGALILPMGTLATLLWMYILKKNKIPISWGKYVQVVIVAVPISTAVTLVSLYLWSRLFF